MDIKKAQISHKDGSGSRPYAMMGFGIGIINNCAFHYQRVS